MSWESSAEYYRIINQTVKEKLGGLHSAKINMISIDFEQLSELQHKEKWEKATKIIKAAAFDIEKNSDFIVICSVTGHESADLIENNLNVPLLHIADAVGRKIEESQYKTMGLLGTRFTMEKKFFKSRLSENYGVNVVVPPKLERDIIHQIIYDELCKGKLIQHSKQQLQKIIQNLYDEGAEAIILGCTELPLLIKNNQCNIPLLDVTSIHAKYAADLAMDNNVLH